MLQLFTGFVEHFTERHRHQFQMRGQALEFRRRQGGEQMVLIRAMGADMVNIEIRGLLILCGQFHTDSAVTDKAAGPVEHRLPTHLKLLLRAIGIDAAEDEIQKRLSGGDICLQYFRSVSFQPVT